MRIIWYTAMSMDGRIASAEDSLGFLELIGPSEGPSEGDQRDEWGEFIGTIDAVILGASTLRWLIAGGHGWAHDHLPTWLVSHDESLVDQVGETRAPLQRVEGCLDEMLTGIEAAGHEHVWLCGGGDIAGQLLRLDHVDEVIATVAPTVLGAGPALFDGADLPQRRFRLEECRPGGGDAARLRWVRDR
jgi:dihydrofolate reductase